ncbi:hypothetical protein WR25_04160 [Diploscapter pachys]|uniref:DUF4440 domain-containing protein n=1 Tax=Diploscapter pachys TaxID=2018661 RepID=A0A2A2J4Q5_9BILA|nr:hypothetical protein WR25_04160 [Diploscapter pachys]
MSTVPPQPSTVPQTQLDQDTRPLLESYVRHYVDTLSKALLDQMGAFYDKNAVLVETDKSVLWGRKDIEDSLRAMTTEFGKTTMSVSNESFRGTAEFPIYEADFVFHTEKAGDLKGHEQQIWKKQNDGYVIYHDEYSME